MSIFKTILRDGHTLTLNVRRESVVLMQDTNLSFTFDAGGRMVSAFRGGKNFRRSLDNQILEKASGSEPGLSARMRRMLDAGEIEKLEKDAYAFAAHVPARVTEPLSQEAMDALAHVNAYSYARLEQERIAFHELYRPVSILPPDQYLALYLQATEGCSYNECTFCGLYRDRRFHAKTSAEFRQHLADARAFFGDGISMRRTLFLGDANALIAPHAQLLEWFDALHEAFAIVPRDMSASERRAWQEAHPLHFDGVYSFIDAFTTKRKTAEEFAALAARGLRRVYIGLESGDPALLHFLGKPNQPDDVIQLVKRLKASGVAVGMIILIGAGGAEYSAGHVRETARLVNALPLDANDLIYFSELVDYPGSSYAEHANAAGVRALATEEMHAQEKELRAAFTFADARNAPKISYYDLREFVY